MKKNFVLITIGAVIIVTIVGFSVYSYSQIEVSLKDVSSIEINLAPLSFSDLIKLGLDALSGDWISVALELISEINLGLAFQLSNNGVFPVYVPNLSYDLLIDGNFVGHGYSNVDTLVYPGETKEIFVIQNLQKSDLNPALDSIIEKKGIVQVEIKGTSNFELLGQTIPIEFGSTKQISITEEIQNQINQRLEN